MKKNLIVLGIAICGLAMTALPLSAQDTKPKKPKPEHYSALAYLPSGAGPRMVGAGATMNVDIVIQSYSTDAEAQAMAQLLLSSGSDAVLKALQKKKSIGKVSLVGQVGFFDLKLIRSRPVEGGRLVMAVSDRPIGFLEAYNSGRSMDYTFGILQMQLKAKEEDKGEKQREEGEGTLIYAAKVKVIDKTKIEIENYGISPVELKGVRRL
jgi:hypothetical protein